jgi:hypothetical protein
VPQSKDPLKPPLERIKRRLKVEAMILSLAEVLHRTRRVRPSTPVSVRP